MVQQLGMSAPALSTGNSILTCSAVTASYVGCLYLFSTHRISSGKGDRDDAQIIKHRLQVASASTAASVAGCVALLAHTGTGSLYARIAAALCVMGMPFVPDRTADLASSAATGISRHLVSVVFFPLVLTTLPYLASTYSDYLRGGLRNYVIGPMTEELVFRSCVVGISSSAGLSRSTIIFLTPLYFSIAHLHHAWEGYLKGGRTRSALKSAALRSTIQLAYTTVFGWYATYLLLRTGNILAPFVSHVYCNVMGLPSFGAPRESNRSHVITARVLAVLGLTGFVTFFSRLTEPSLFGGSSLW